MIPVTTESLLALTERLWRNKLNKHFNVTDVGLEFAYLFAEIAELMEARGDEVAGEAADVLNFLLSLVRLLLVPLAALSGAPRKLPAPEVTGLVSDTAKMFEAWRRDHPVTPAAVAVFRRLQSIASAEGIDLIRAGHKKLTRVESRTYELAPSGLYRQAGGA